jgi:hypothetical protein
MKKSLIATFKKPLAVTAISMAIATVSAPTYAELSGNVSVTNNYIWRGLTQSINEAAIQGGLDYSSESGFYMGTWASNVSYDSDDAGRKIRGLLGSCLQRAGRMLPRCSARVVARTALAVLRVRACSPTAVAALRTEVPNSERANLFVRKLRLCSVICDFSDGGGNDRDKEIKRQVCKLHACLLFQELDLQRVWFPCLTTFAGADAPRACGLCQQRKTAVRRADHAGSCCNG